MRILIIQTAFIGDVILSTPLIESIKKNYPDARIDFLLRSGNQGLLQTNPKVSQLFVWNKSKKYKSLFRLVREINASGEKYDYLINLQRFLSTGIFSMLIKAKNKIGFAKNPLSLFYTERQGHLIEHDIHEVDRNLSLVSSFCKELVRMPKLYPSEDDYLSIEKYKAETYVCIAPTSVWFTKQFPLEQWVQLINHLTHTYKVYLLGGNADWSVCEQILRECDSEQVHNLAGNLSLLESAALIEKAFMSYVNDSAPLHLASAMNAPTTAIFCSTTPRFGFGPLAENARIVETSEKLSCRPCGLHGKKACPEGHFKCATTISIDQLLYR